MLETLLLLGWIASAAVPQSDEAHLIAFEYGGDVPPTNFRLWYDGGIVKNYSQAEVLLGRSATPNAQGEYTYTLSAPPFPSLSSHTMRVTAYTVDGQYATEPSSNTVTVAPECRLVTVGGGGE